MSVLNSWQKISRVSPGRPFGNGSTGAYTSTTIPTLVDLSVAGVATETHIHATAANFSAGDIILLHQTRGTGAGQWEIEKITADNGDGTYALSTALHYTYTDSGASQAQVIKIPQYSSVTIASGTWTGTAWDGNVGGILPFACNGTVNLANTITFLGKGFDGGDGRSPSASAIWGYQGESTTGTGTTAAEANGMAGGGAKGGDPGRSGGGGGGYAAAGTGGVGAGGSPDPGDAGGADGTADLTEVFFGGAGGAGGQDSTEAGAAGGNSGGIVMIFAKNISAVNSITAAGAAGANGNQSGGGGGGAGGAVLVVCQTATLGATKVVATAGAAGSSSNSGAGGAGAAGMIAVHHSGAITGTTNPTFTNVTDGSLVESGGFPFYALT